MPSHQSHKDIEARGIVKVASAIHYCACVGRMGSALAFATWPDKVFTSTPWRTDFTTRPGALYLRTETDGTPAPTITPIAAGSGTVEYGAGPLVLFKRNITTSMPDGLNTTPTRSPSWPEREYRP